MTLEPALAEEDAGEEDVGENAEAEWEGGEGSEWLGAEGSAAIHTLRWRVGGPRDPDEQPGLTLAQPSPLQPTWARG